MNSIIGSNAESLQSMFSLPSTMITTSGIQEGIILKFKTFYLKFYDGDTEGTYIVKGFRYQERKHIFEELLPTFKLREFAQRFTREDYLLGFQTPCDDPQCLLHNYAYQGRYPDYDGGD